MNKEFTINYNYKLQENTDNNINPNTYNPLNNLKDLTIQLNEESSASNKSVSTKKTNINHLTNLNPTFSSYNIIKNGSKTKYKNPYENLKICNTKNIPLITDYVGIINQKNTCYINTIIQTLFMTMEFRYKILNMCDPSHKIMNRSQR